jgi:hypothetical protein
MLPMMSAGMNACARLRLNENDQQGNEALWRRSHVRSTTNFERSYTSVLVAVRSQMMTILVRRCYLRSNSSQRSFSANLRFVDREELDACLTTVQFLPSMCSNVSTLDSDEHACTRPGSPTNALEDWLKRNLLILMIAPFSLVVETLPFANYKRQWTTTSTDLSI